MVATAELTESVAKARSLYDLLFFYREILLHGNRRYQEALGKIHGFMADFLRLDELQCPELDGYRNSPIRDYMPDRDENGCWPERWMYWPTLDAEPQIEDGGECSLSADFQAGRLLTEDRGGLLLRVVGDGDMLYQLVSRGFLKTSLGTFARSMQDVVREPTTRIAIRSGEEELPAKVMGLIKFTFEDNPVFKQFWSDLVPERHSAVWNKTQMQVASNAKDGFRGRRGADPTLAAYGIGTNITGAHVDKLVFDDVVTLQNLNLQEKVIDKVSEAAFVVDRDFSILGQGTLYRDDDAHSIFVRPSGGGYPYTSMLIASLLDSRGEPMWEYYDHRLIEKKKGMCMGSGRGLSFWYAQQWNNPFLFKEEGFKEEWLSHTYEGGAEAAVKEYKLSVVIAVDPGYGTSESAGYASAIVKGQDEAGRRYTLDGFREKLTPDELPEAIVNLAKYWDNVVRKCGRGGIRMGIEEASMKSWLFPSIKNWMRRKGVAWSVEPLKHGNKAKLLRVRSLGPPYASGSCLWPEGDMPRFTRQWLNDDADGKPYDLKKVHRNEFLKHPAIRPELLDSEAYAEQMMRPDPMNVGDDRNVPEPVKRPSVYRRGDDKDEQSGRGRYIPRGVAAANTQVRRSGGKMGRAMPMGEDEWQ